MIQLKVRCGIRLTCPEVTPTEVSGRGYTVYIEGTDIMVNDSDSYPSVP
jgi:hypothetical protein